MLPKDALLQTRLWSIHFYWLNQICSPKEWKMATNKWQKGTAQAQDIPAQPFYNFKASRSGDGRNLYIVYKRRATDFTAPKLWKGQSCNDIIKNSDQLVIVIPNLISRIKSIVRTLNCQLFFRENKYVPKSMATVCIFRLLELSIRTEDFTNYEHQILFSSETSIDILLGSKTAKSSVGRFPGTLYFPPFSFSQQ